MTAPGKNAESFRSLALSSGMPDRIFGFQKMKGAYHSIRRNGLRSFINSTIIYRIRLHAFRLQILILYRVNLYGSYNKRCPDKSRFLPLIPVSPRDVREGRRYVWSAAICLLAERRGKCQVWPARLKISAMMYEFAFLILRDKKVITSLIFRSMALMSVHCTCQNFQTLN